MFDLLNHGHNELMSYLIHMFLFLRIIQQLNGKRTNISELSERELTNK